MDIKDTKGKLPEGAVAGPEMQPDAPPPSPIRMGFLQDRPATLMIQLDLDRMGRPTARGHLLHADEVICTWYEEAKKVADERSIKRIVRSGLDKISELARGRKN